MNYTDILIEDLSDTLLEDYVSPYLNYSDRKEAAEIFFDKIKNNIIDSDSFHKAFDKDLNAYGLLDDLKDAYGNTYKLFLDNGHLLGRKTYSAVKDLSNKAGKKADVTVALGAMWASEFGTDYATGKQNNGKYEDGIVDAGKQTTSQSGGYTHGFKKHKPYSANRDDDVRDLEFEARKNLPEVLTKIDQVKYAELKSLVDKDSCELKVFARKNSSQQISIYIGLCKGNDVVNYGSKADISPWGTMVMATSTSADDLATAINSKLDDYIATARKINVSVNEEKTRRRLSSDFFGLPQVSKVALTKTKFEDQRFLFKINNDFKFFVPTRVSDHTELYTEDIHTGEMIGCTQTDFDSLKTAQIVGLQVVKLDTGVGKIYWSFDSDSIPDDVQKDLHIYPNDDNSDNYDAQTGTYYAKILSGREAKQSGDYFKFGNGFDSWAILTFK